MTYFKTIILVLFSVVSLSAQIVKILPLEASANQELELIYDAKQGTKGLVGATSVYMHSGVVIDRPDGTAWESVVGNWGKDDGIGKMIKVDGETDVWSIKLSPTAKSYYGVNFGVPIFRLAMVFRNEDGTKEGKGNSGNFNGGFVASNSDIFVDLNVTNYVQILQPKSSIIFLEQGIKQAIDVEASGVANKISLFLDEGKGFELVQEVLDSKKLQTEIKPNKTGFVNIKAEAIFGIDTQTVSKEIQFVFRRAISSLELPKGLIKGINYSEDQTKVSFVLEAPLKDFVYLVGDFSSWEIKDEFLMNQTPDGELFWLEISNLSPQKEYVFQYWVDGTLKIPDPYAEKVADPWNDDFIPASIYPNLPEYHHTDFGIASVFQTGQPEFIWNASENSWQKPDKESLIIYELLIRDFIGSHSYKDLTDTLSYLKRLGVNTIELMPIMEFEGNESWGYNVSQFFAPDKYYGTKNDLKNFIQTAHQQGFAVLLDMVLNHAFGQNPLVRMYWDETQNKPSTENPWFNVDAKHLYNVGYDFNHESSYTQAFVDSVNSYWLKEFHFDGFRFDLTKGFTQKEGFTDASLSAKDDSRIAILKRMASKIREVSPDAFIILEHFATESEENILRADGMMTWGNNNHDFGDLMKGKTNQRLGSVDDVGRVSYMESHDEPRQIYLVENASIRLKSTYDPRKERVALNRLKMMSAFFFTQPGPKMMWQFQELGYDIDINFNGRTGNKPLPWGENGLGYYQSHERQKLLKTNSAILKLINQNQIVFKKGKLTKSMAGAVKSLLFEQETMDIAIIGNFDIQNSERSFAFSRMGTWYNYFQKDSISVTGNMDFDLAPGEFHIYTTVKQKDIADSLITFFEANDTLILQGQIVTISPIEFQPDLEITITFDAAEADGSGTSGLIDAAKVYMHSGVILDDENGTSWEYVVGNWGLDNGLGEMTKVADSDSKWQITIKPEKYYSSVPDNVKWARLGMVFRNGDGSKEGKALGGEDIFVNFKVKELLLGMEQLKSISLYPNPSGSFFQIEGLGAIESVNLIDISGRTIRKYNIQERYSVQNLASGMYLVAIKTAKKSFIKRLLID
ncbi:MAG: glycosidase [Psychromonas sp.]|jgi:glycosidase